MIETLRERILAVPAAVQSAAWMAVVLLAGVVTWWGFSAWRAADVLRDRAETVAALLERDAADTAEDSRKRAPAIARLGERRFFSPAPPQAFRNARGVLGDRVLYSGGQSFKVGDNAMGATVKEIGLTHVELEFEGETVRVNFGGGGGSRSGSSGRRRGRRSRR